MWHQPRPGVIRPDHPASSQPGRQPASQQRALADRYHPDAHRRRHQRLRHPTQGRGQEEKGDHSLPQAAHRPTDLPTADQPAPNPELRPATHPTPTRRHHRDPGRPSSQHPPQPHLSTRTRPTPQPPPRYQIPELAPNPPSRPIPDLTNIGASNSSDRRGPWRDRDQVEYATLEYVDWFNHRRLLEPIGHIPPAEKEANYHRQQKRVQLAGLK